MTVCKLENISYYYNPDKPVIKDCNYSFEKGKVYAIVGPSGAGKTTLLSMLSSLAKPTIGKILFNGKDVATIDPYDYRSNMIGVIFQSYNLLPSLTAKENVQLSMDICKNNYPDKDQRALDLLNRVGLNQDMAERRILKLSGGEQQRVAIARTLSYDPEMILADEPTGNLDGKTQDKIMDIFLDLAHKENKCIIIVTHSKEVANRADECFELKKVK